MMTAEARRPLLAVRHGLPADLFRTSRTPSEFRTMFLLRARTLSFPGRARATVLWGLCLAAAAVLLPASSRAQEGEKKIPEPADVNFTTKDGVRLRATYWGGTKGKESVPVILLHEFKGNRRDLAGLATSLQKKHGHAVIAVDLRGHGDSTEVANTEKKLDCNAPSFAPQFPLMIKYDMEAVKTFLFDKNDAGDLNVDKLCVVGAEMGASVGMIWTSIDWSWPPLAPTKQGQDVKLVVMISPEPAFRTLRITDNVAPRDAIPDVLLERAGVQVVQAAAYKVRNDMSIYVAVGARDSAAMADATRVFSTFERAPERARRKPTKPEELDAIFDKTLDTKLQGTKLLQGLGLDENIAKFIQMRVADKPLPWQVRKAQ